MIYDLQLKQRWLRIKRHLSSNIQVFEQQGILVIEMPTYKIYLAKKSSKMRLKSHLDWSFYTPKTLANAINNNSVESYYEIMLNDIRSDPNEWKDRNFEMELKSYYAARENRASLLP